MLRRYKPGPESGSDMHRLFAFSDGVFAIAITLLALDLKVPALPDDRLALLPAEVLKQLPSFLGYAISFVVIGAYWNAHHRLFRIINRYDNRLLWLNVLFLMTMCFLLYPTLLVNRYPNQAFSVIFYAATVAAIGLMMILLWGYAAVGNRLLDEHVNADQVRQATVRLLTPPAFFLASIPFAFYNSAISQLIWILAMFIRPTLRQRAHAS